MLNEGENVEKRLRQGSVYRFTVRLKNDEEQCWLFEEIALLPDTSVALPMKYAFCPRVRPLTYDGLVIWMMEDSTCMLTQPLVLTCLVLCQHAHYFGSSSRVKRQFKTQGSLVLVSQQYFIRLSANVFSSFAGNQ